MRGAPRTAASTAPPPPAPARPGAAGSWAARSRVGGWGGGRLGAGWRDDGVVRGVELAEGRVDPDVVAGDRLADPGPEGLLAGHLLEPVIDHGRRIGEGPALRDQLDDVVAELGLDGLRCDLARRQGEGSVLELGYRAARLDPAEVAPCSLGAGVRRVLPGELGEVVAGDRPLVDGPGELEV